MKRIVILKAIVAIAVVMTFVMPVAAVANIGALEVTSNNCNNTGNAIVSNIPRAGNSNIGHVSGKTGDTSFVEITDVTAMSKSKGIVYVDDNQVPGWYDATHVRTIHEGINNATAGGTVYVYNGTYNEYKIFINITLNLVGQSRTGVIVSGNGTGSGNMFTINAAQVNISSFTMTNCRYILYISSSNNKIQYCTIDNMFKGVYLIGSSLSNQFINCIFRNSKSTSGYGIQFYASSNNIIRNCSSYNNVYGFEINSGANNNNLRNCSVYNNTDRGIDITGSTTTSITNCSLYNNTKCGIYISSSSSSTSITNCSVHNNGNGSYNSGSNSNSITNCNVYNNDNYGIYLISSTSIKLRGNTIHDNKYNFEVEGTSSSHFTQDIDQSNFINGKKIYYLISQSNLILNQTNNVGYLGLVSCTKITLMNSNVSGIVMVSTTYSTILNVSCHNCGNGIYLFSSTKDNIRNCTSYNNNNGIYLDSSSNTNNITNCTIRNNNNYGIYLVSSTGTKLRGNIINNNVYNFAISGTTVSHYTQDIDQSNFINGRKMYYLVGQSNLMLNETNNVGYIGLVSCTKITVKNSDVSGIVMVSTTYSTILNVSSHNSGNGIYLLLSSNHNNITNCRSYSNSGYGIYLYSSASYNNITNCNVYKATSYGIYIYTTSSRNRITNCHVYQCISRGIYIYTTSNNNNITNCNVNNTGNGIIIFTTSNNNNITNCNVYNNTGNGIALTMNVNKNNITNCNVYNNTGNGIFLSGASLPALPPLPPTGPATNTTITHCNVYNNKNTGIQLTNSLNTTLHGNTIYNNFYNFGVSGTTTTQFLHHIDPFNTINGKPIYYLTRQSNLTLNATNNIGYLGLIFCKNITTKDASVFGILMVNTNRSTISNVSVHNTPTGISLTSSSNNSIVNCHAYNDSTGISASGSNNNFTNCNVYNCSGTGISVGGTNSKVTNCNVHNCGGTGISFSGTNSKVANCHVHHNGRGGWGIQGGAYTTISNCEIDHNGVGAGSSTNGTIINCSIHDSVGDGIDFTGTSYPNERVINCTIYNNPGNGIFLWSSPRGTFRNCHIYNCSTGILLWNSADNNNFINCVINNTNYGIFIRNCLTNSIQYNNLINNKYGVWIQEASSTNIVHHNNFANSILNAYDSAPDLWDNGSVGNYWSDYHGVDADHNGIGDTPYNISGGSSQDHFPLMLPLDATPPVIVNVQATPAVQRPNASVNITCTVTDNWNMVNAVKINISGPGGFVLVAPMSHGSSYYYNRSYATMGNYQYFIQANDSQGNVAVSGIYSFIIADLDKPTSAVNPLSPWKTITPFSITATAYDNTGVANVSLWYRYSSNGTSWTAWTFYGIDFAAPWSWSFTGSDGYYQFYSIAVDNYGNVEDAPGTADASTGIDTTKPVTTAIPAPPIPNGQHGWYVSNVTVTLSAVDAVSGVASTWYKVDAGGWTLYTVPFTPGDGNHTVQYYSIDHAGNTENTKSAIIKVDRAAPTTTLILQGLLGSQGWYVTNVSVTLSAYDATSGVNYTKYKLNNGSWMVYTGSFVLTTNGNYTLYYYSVDIAGNSETIKQMSFRIQHDVLPPVTTPGFSGVMGNNNWFVSPVTVTLNAVDDSAGVAITKYQLDAGAWKTYTGAFQVATDAVHSLLYYSVDKVGNTETVKGAIFKIDQTPPTINLTVNRTGLSRWLLTANVSDSMSGVAKVEFYLNGVLLGNVTASPYTFVCTKEGTAQAIVYDNAGLLTVSGGVPVILDLNMNSGSLIGNQGTGSQSQSQSQNSGSTSMLSRSVFRLFGL